MNNSQISCAIIGSGNIGTDLMFKLFKSKRLKPEIMVGIDENSAGIALAKEKGLLTITNGIEGFIKHAKDVEVVFEATSAKAHFHHAPILKDLGLKVVDLTPAAVGPFVVPSVNLNDKKIKKLDNVNMVTCGGQATTPIVKAISNVVDVEYAELVSSVASKSAGPGTRQNIDEFTVTTTEALKKVGGAKDAKTIIILNPANPPIIMRNTIYAKIKEDTEAIRERIFESLHNMVESVKTYVPGYRFHAKPIIKDKIVTVFLEVEGDGDFLPTYAGNLDIITSAAVRTGELMAGTY